MSAPEADPAGRDLTVCADCQTELGPGLLECPGCGRLVHAKRLADLAAQAAAEQDPRRALAAWRQASLLLPSRTRQYRVIQATIERLERQAGLAPGEELEVGDSADNGPKGDEGAGQPRSGMLKAGAGIGALALLAWKFKVVLAFALGKFKLLALGLTKAKTFFSMVLAFGVYWTAWGWAFALGLVVLIYIHEMGHVAALRSRGVPASAPMFIPGIGAFVRMKQYPQTPQANARIGLAGPLWGLAAAVVTGAVFGLTSIPFWAAMTRVGATINLFNLIPIWQLDGARGMSSLSRNGRWAVTVAMAATWLLTGEGLLILLLLGALYQTLFKPPAETPDPAGTALFILLLAAHGALSQIPTGTIR